MPVCFSMSSTTISLCSWNVRGLGDETKCAAILSELISINPHCALLQESKLNDINDRKLNSFLPRSLDQRIFLPANGSAGGTISAFNKNYFSLISHSHSHHTYATSTQLTSLAHPLPFVITNIYAPSNRNLKQAFLNELDLIKEDDHTPWLIVGDFNLIRFSHENNNPNFHQ